MVCCPHKYTHTCINDCPHALTSIVGQVRKICMSLCNVHQKMVGEGVKKLVKGGLATK